MFKTFFWLLGLFLSVPFLVFAVLAFQLPISGSGVGYLLAAFLLIASLVFSPWLSKHWMVALLSSGMLALAIVVASRTISITPQPEQQVQMISLPAGTKTGWMGNVLDEQDVAVWGEALFHRIGGSSAREHAGITQALYGEYSTIRHVQPVLPSPVLSTYLNLQRPEAFDAVLIHPLEATHPETALVFLHGFMGNVSAQCWRIGQATMRLGVLTICPSTGWQGQWWQPDGQAILRATLDYLRKQGIREIYLGGFSNGGFGLSQLAATIQDVNELHGLIFIDGISNDRGIRETGLPVLIIQGVWDERMPASEAKQIATLLGEQAAYVEVDSDHFLIMKKPQAVNAALSAWLETQMTK
jgi:pimeloyl-ACP methyl ester carboxylesterase